MAAIGGLAAAVEPCDAFYTAVTEILSSADLLTGNSVSTFEGDRPPNVSIVWG